MTDPFVLARLFERGLEVRERADTRANLAAEYRFDVPDLFTLALAPTGVPSDVVDDLYRGLVSVDALARAVAITPARGGERESHEGPSWGLRRVTLARHVDRPLRPGVIEGVVRTATTACDSTAGRKDG